MISTADLRTHLCYRRSFRLVAGKFGKTRDRDYLPAAAVLAAAAAAVDVAIANAVAAVEFEL